MGQQSTSSFIIAQFCVEKYDDGKHSVCFCPLLPAVLANDKHGWSVAHGALCQRQWTHTVAQEMLQKSNLEALWGNQEGALPQQSQNWREPLTSSHGYL